MSSYPRFDDVMVAILPSYRWEAIEVTTSDDYILTMFKVWNEATIDASKGPVFFQHGHGMDGVDWFIWNE